jgi:hypothetical protein
MRGALVADAGAAAALTPPLGIGPNAGRRRARGPATCASFRP